MKILKALLNAGFMIMFIIRSDNKHYNLSDNRSFSYRLKM